MYLKRKSPERSISCSRCQRSTLTFTYDSTVRLVAVTDALGQVTTLQYQDPSDPLRLTTVTDPFGRAVTLTYDPLGRLASITDVAGMTSSFSYSTADFLTAMTTVRDHRVSQRDDHADAAD